MESFSDLNNHQDFVRSEINFCNNEIFIYIMLQKKKTLHILIKMEVDF